MIYVSPAAVESLVTAAGATRGSGAFSILYARTVGLVVCFGYSRLPTGDSTGS